MLLFHRKMEAQAISLIRLPFPLHTNGSLSFVCLFQIEFEVILLQID